MSRTWCIVGVMLLAGGEQAWGQSIPIAPPPAAGWASQLAVAPLPVAPAVAPSAGIPAWNGGALPAVPTGAAGQVAPAPAPLLAPIVTSPPAPPPKIWTGSLEFGLNAAEGNSEIFNLRAGAHAKRKTDDNVVTLDLDYKKDTSRDIETANRLFGEAREEFLLEPTPWTLFVHGTTEYDEFKNFDVRLSADAGVGYRFIRSDTITFTGRAGAGVSHEVGGPDDGYVPEGVFGLDYEHKFSKCHKFTAGTEYYPDWTDFQNYRLNSRAHWEIQMENWSNVVIKIGTNDRYDSTPGTAEYNDLDYSVTLLWNF